MEKITLYMDCYGFLHGTEKECKIIEDMEEVVLIEDINEDDYECVDERENTNEQLFCETIISPSVFLLNKRLCKEENQEQLEILFLLSLCTICEQASYEDISLYKVSVLIKNNVF